MDDEQSALMGGLCAAPVWSSTMASGERVTRIELALSAWEADGSSGVHRPAGLRALRGDAAFDGSRGPVCLVSAVTLTDVVVDPAPREPVGS